MLIERAEKHVSVLVCACAFNDIVYGKSVSVLVCACAFNDIVYRKSVIISHQGP